MPKETTTLSFLGVGDLRKRWHFTRQGIHQRKKFDKDFPEPEFYINNGRDAVYALSDIKAYESLRTHLTTKGGWDFRQKKAEFLELENSLRAERENEYFSR